MGVMGIGEMPMAVAQPRMGMGMAMRLARRIPGRMIMAVMDVMVMTMVMGETHMLMLVDMALGQMQPKPGQHQGAGQQKLRGDRLAQDHPRESALFDKPRRANTFGGRRIGTGQGQRHVARAHLIAEDVQQ